MKPIEVLKQLNLINWAVLFTGFQRGWIIKSDISNYSVSLLSDSLDDGDENIAVLASADSFDDSEVKELLLKISDQYSEPEIIERWKLAMLITLNESGLSEEEKIDRLQELYAEYDYPEDMSSCSIYSQDSVPPLKAMSDVILSLKGKLIS